MQKIAIIGSAGSGKSTLARQIGGILGVEVIHLDNLFWTTGWVQIDRETFCQLQQQLVLKPEWIIDGNYSGTLDIRLQTADTVIFLDLPRALCLWRAIKRRFAYHNRTRPDMASGCPEKMDLGFALWIWNYPERSRPSVLKKLEQPRPGQQVVVLRSSAEVRRFLQRLRQSRR